MQVFISTLSYINLLSQPTAGKDCTNCDNIMKHTCKICIYEQHEENLCSSDKQKRREIEQLNFANVTFMWINYTLNFWAGKFRERCLVGILF